MKEVWQTPWATPTREGYEVFTAYDGRRALEMIQEIQL